MRSLLPKVVTMNTSHSVSPPLHIDFGSEGQGWISLGRLLTWTVAILLASLLFNEYLNMKKRADNRPANAPPIFHFPQEEIAKNGRDIYRKLLKEHGPVIVVPRCGRLEYLLDGRYAKQLFTDHTNFLFEPAILDLLNLDWAMNTRSVDSHVGKLSHFIQKSQFHMPQLIDRASPIIFDCANELGKRIPNSQDEIVVDDIYDWAHHAIAKATVPIIYGEEYLSDSYLTNVLEVTANSIRRISGVDRAQSWTAKHLPTVWKYSTLLHEFFFHLLPTYYLGLLPKLWKNLDRHLIDTPDHTRDGFVPVFSHVCQNFYQESKNWGWKTFVMFNTTIMLGMAFGSIHQSANNGVWVLFYLVQRPEYLAEIRKELLDLMAQQNESDYPTDDTLTKAVKLDAFVNEVMRHKGDTYGPPRLLATDTTIGPYVVPKGANIQVVLFTTHENPDLYPNPTKFDPTRALKANKPASMATEEYLPFGLSKWACPGRFLAVNEMKLLVASIICRYNVRLEKNSYRVRDPITTTAVAPIGRLVLSPLEA